jgi:hypothetical protein
MKTLSGVPRLDRLGAWIEHLAPRCAAAIAHAAHHPALLATAVGLATVATAGAGVARGRLSAWRHERLTRDAYLIQITPPPEADPTGGPALWAHLHGLQPPWWSRLLYGQPHLVWEYAFADRAAQLRLWVPGVIPPGLVERAVTAAWPATTCTTRHHPDPPLPDTIPTTATVLRQARAASYPLRTDHDADPLRGLLDVGAGTRDGEHLLVQVAARPATPRQARLLRRDPTLRATNRAPASTPRTGARAATGLAGTVLLAGARGALNLLEPPRRQPSPRSAPTGAGWGDVWRSAEVRDMLAKTAQPLWQTQLRLVVAADPHGRPSSAVTARLRGRVDQAAAAFAVYTGANSWRRRRAGRRWRDAVTWRHMPPGGDLLAVAELAAVAHLPLDVTVAGVERAGARPVPVPVRVPSGGRGVRPLGVAEVGRRAVGVAVTDARTHLHIPGKTMSGKSTLLQHLILADVRAGRGAVVIDPKGDLVTDLLDRLPDTVADRVWIFDPDQPHPPRLNPLATTDDADLAVDQLVGIFASIFARHWGPRTDDVLRSAALTLLRRSRNATIEHIPALLTDKGFRARMVVDIDDPAGLGGFWAWYDELGPAMRSQVIGPVLARLRAFLLRDFVRRVVGADRPDAGPPLNTDHILNHGGLLLCRLPKGQLGDDTTRLLGSFVLAQVWQAATRRATLPETDRRDATLYLDECVRQEAL